MCVVVLPSEEMGRFSLSSIGPVIIEILFKDGADNDTSASLESDPVRLSLCCNLRFFWHDMIRDALWIAKPPAASASTF
jgi:hypothetical protein